MTTGLPPSSRQGPKPARRWRHLTPPDPGMPDDYEPLPDAMLQEPHFTETMQVVRTLFLSHDTALVSGDTPIYYRDEAGVQRIVRPDCYVAFGVDEVAIRRRNGYYLDEVGHPPDFVLEIASESTHTEDTGRKRDLYARLGVGEYWRFDGSGENFYPELLIGEALVEGEYVPFEMHENADGVIWGYSPALGMDLCWDNQRLRFRDPGAGAYHRNLPEAEALISSQAAALQAAEVRAEVEAAAHEAAQARIRQLEEELRQRRQQ